MKGAFLEELTWAEAAARIDAGAVIVVPVGAAAKEHGLHLPLSTDRRTARALADGIAARLPVLVAPTIDVGYYPAFVAYPGSQHLRAETFIALVTDILDGFVRQGAKRLVIVNTGVSTEAPLQLATRAIFERHGVRVHTADIRRLGRSADNVIENRAGGHADERETSVMLAIAPALVQMKRAKPETEAGQDRPKGAGIFLAPAALSRDPASPDHSASGATGDPTRATAEKGRAVLDAMTDDLVDGLRAAFPDAFGAGS
jgi:creatinine amidohydrolase